MIKTALLIACVFFAHCATAAERFVFGPACYRKEDVEGIIDIFHRDGADAADDAMEILLDRGSCVMAVVELREFLAAPIERSIRAVEVYPYANIPSTHAKRLFESGVRPRKQRLYVYAPLEGKT